MDNNTNKANIKKIAEIVGNVVIWGFVGFSALITILVFSSQGSSDGIPSLLGKSLLTIQTASMEQTYNVGDMVFMSKLSDEEKMQLQPGDIITYRAPIDINGDGKIGAQDYMMAKRHVLGTYEIIDGVLIDFNA